MEQQTVKNLNVFLLGLAFMLVFAAFQTMGNVQTVILDSAKNKTSGQCTLRGFCLLKQNQCSLCQEGKIVK